MLALPPPSTSFPTNASSVTCISCFASMGLASSRGSHVASSYPSPTHLTSASFPFASTATTFSGRIASTWNSGDTAGSSQLALCLFQKYRSFPSVMTSHTEPGIHSVLRRELNSNFTRNSTSAGLPVNAGPRVGHARRAAVVASGTRRDPRMASMCLPLTYSSATVSLKALVAAVSSADFLRASSRTSHAGQNHLPLGTCESLGLRQYRWWPASHPSQRIIFCSSSPRSHVTHRTVRSSSSSATSSSSSYEIPDDRAPVRRVERASASPPAVFLRLARSPDAGAGDSRAPRVAAAARPPSQTRAGSHVGQAHRPLGTCESFGLRQ